MSTLRYDPWKRLIDVVAAGLGLVLTAPLQAVIAVLVRRNLGSPVFFRQQRPGKGEELFTLVKFRTMREPDVASGLADDAVRLTPFGRWLRSTSLDELPTLWNVLAGDMSLVGPRPLLPQYLGRYNSTQRRRHEVRPGVTGLAQVSGRNAITWEQKFAHDIFYVDNRSLRLDLRIVARTLSSIVRRTGISAADEATMPEFMGSPEGTS